MVKYLLYVLRWVVLAVPGALFFNKVREFLGIENVYTAMVISQAVMGAMVFFLDRLIFTSGAVPVPWEVKPNVICTDCGREDKCYRVPNAKCCQIKEHAGSPGFRCKQCALKKMQQIDG